ncbi:hypothetical protein PPTG_14955 [Phytophthora nicotianae INRA-310]|uniref:Uncharacterized protein n=1 Tax=Phytophthora nicotianae (strain INRA-310) TaxID=761204 RepID=W2PTG8_PHYN3|nr:hypothetical protein PPTG_14955 [Phytophthora nicotianae INRA-310]ETN04253.1 hypothetical protein PPTG_14955 [Phytophthora nicotianae INRA-310]
MRHNDQRTVCDTGSQAYCTNANTILSDQCRKYVDRVVKTKNDSAYKDRVRFASNSTKTITDYCNALSDVAHKAINGVIVASPTLDHPLRQEQAFKNSVVQYVVNRGGRSR